MRASHQAFFEIGIRRIERILRSHLLASMRTLEQKISDAGPYDQRVDPHILTEARNYLEAAGSVRRIQRSTGLWYYHTTTPEPQWRSRLAVLEPIVRRIQTGDRPLRIGQAFEVATYRALDETAPQHQMHFLGAFADLSDDKRPFKKEDPPKTFSGRSLPEKQRLDFYVVHQEAGLAESK